MNGDDYYVDCLPDDSAYVVKERGTAGKVVATFPVRKYGTWVLARDAAWREARRLNTKPAVIN